MVDAEDVIGHLVPPGRLTQGNTRPRDMDAINSQPMGSWAWPGCAGGFITGHHSSFCLPGSRKRGNILLSDHYPNTPKQRHTV